MLFEDHKGISYNFTFGADPEIFIQKDGKPVSAHGLIPGDKKNPHKVPFGAVQVDGMALEFNINPAKGEAGFLRNLDSVMNHLMQMVPGYSLFDQPVAAFGLDYIEAQPQEAKDLGCEPDYNAWTKDINPRPNVKTPFRTASGHIHIGWTDNADLTNDTHFEACCILAKCLDVTLGIPSLLWDEDNLRRELYGKAGSFRPKPYGMEYRVLSNRWLRTDKPHLRRFVFNNTVLAVKKAFKDPEWGENKIMGVSPRDIIDNGDRDKARNFLGYQKPFPLPISYAKAA
jgi:hypothetical protein